VTGRLVHLNGAPGAGKSTIARALVARRPGWLNCDIDVLRHLFGGWEADHTGTGSLVRPVALAMISAHLAGGHDVVLPQLLADPAELERFVAAATGVGASYTGILLDLPDETLADRWRSRDTTQPTTAASNRVIASAGGDEVVLGLARRLRGLAATRTDTTVLGLGGLDVATVLERLEVVLQGAAWGPARA
jgi:predicted kinase